MCDSRPSGHRVIQNPIGFSIGGHRVILKPVCDSLDQRTSRFYLFICSLHYYYYYTPYTPRYRTTPYYLSRTGHRRRRKIDSIAAYAPTGLPNRKPTAYLYAAYIVSYRITYNYRNTNTTVL
jgi:hypothetical protein